MCCIDSILNYDILWYKIEWFVDFSATNNIDNLTTTCVIIHDNLTCVDYHETIRVYCSYICGARGLFSLFFYNYNKQNNTWMFGNAKFISRVEQDISLVRFAHLRDILVNTRNKFHISSHPGIILYLIQGEHFNATINIVPLKKRIFLAKKTTNLLSKIHLSLKT